MFSKKNLLTIIILIIIIGTVIQVKDIFIRTKEDTSKVYHALGQPSIWRSANFGASQRFANYILFLGETIPENARVVIPPAAIISGALSHTPFMQYFLVPREIINCTSIDPTCANNLSSAGAYLLYIKNNAYYEDFAEDSYKDRITMFDENWGIIKPQTEIIGKVSEYTPFYHIEEIMAAAIGPLLWILGLTLSGFLLVNALNPNENVISKIGFGYGLSLGFFTLLTFLPLAAGLTLNNSLILIVTSLILSGSLIIHYFHIKSRKETLISNPLSKFEWDPWIAAISILAVIAGVISVGKGYNATDAIVLWGAKGYGIAAEGLVKGLSNWGTSTTTYPPNIPILIGTFKSLFGDLLPSSKFIFPLFYFYLMLIIHKQLSSIISRNYAGLSTMAFATSPLIFRHGIVGYANMPFTYYIVCGTLISGRVLWKDKRDAISGELLLGGIFFALAAWTRPEGIYFVLLLLIGLLIKTLFSNFPKIQWRKTFSLFLPAFIILIIQIATSTYIYTQSTGTDDLISTAYSEIFDGNLHFSAIPVIGQFAFGQLIDFNTWGLTGTILLLFLVILVLLKNRRLFSSPIIWNGFLALGFTLGTYYLTSYSISHDINWWLRSGFNRMILPGATLLYIGFSAEFFEEYQD